MNLKMRLVIAVALFVPTPSHALDDLANGKRLAVQWCSSCHLVTPDQKQAKVDVPPFMTIAKRSEEDLDQLPAFLADPHSKITKFNQSHQMPNFNLSRQAISDLVAYIRSLKP